MSDGAGHIFLSHNAQDKPEVERLARQMLDRGLRPWLDKWEIAPGRSWQDALQTAIEQAGAVLVCVGQHGLGRVQLPEVEAALDRAFQDSSRRVVPVLLRGAPVDLELPPFLKQRRAVDLRTGESAYRELFALLQNGRSRMLGAATGSSSAPFRGLEAFEERHARWFFGREADLGRLLAMLGARRLVAVIGASGSGKSSLVRAGLVPAVRTGELDQSYDWVPLVLRPGPRPLHELALRVANALSVACPLAELREAIARDPQRLADELDREAVRGENELRFLLVVDQLEEIFTQCPERDARSAFLAALVHAASAPGGRTHVVCTLRADFLAGLLDQPGLADVLHGANVMLGPLSREGLRAAIERPLLLAGLELEPGLAELLIEEVAGEPGDLPLLQFALAELWQQREGRRLTRAAYQQMRGVRGGLERRADAELEKLAPEQRERVRRLFSRLVQLGEGTADTRRRLVRADLTAAHPELEVPLEALIRARLLTAHEQDVEVAHEALIREWGTLRDWIQADRGLLRVQLEIARAAALWQQSADAADLWSGGRLARALELRATGQLTLSAPEEAFLRAAQEEAERVARTHSERRERELAAARILAQSQASAARRLRISIGAALGLLVLVGSSTYVARQSQRAAQSALDAVQRTLGEAIGVASLLVGQVNRDLADVAGASELRRRLLESGAALLDRLEGAADEATLSDLLDNRAAFHEQRAELALAAEQVERARQQSEAALAIRTRFAAQWPNNSAAQLARAAAQERLAEILERMGETAGARHLYEEALATRERLLDEKSSDRESRLALARAYRGLGNAMNYATESSEVLRHYRRSMAILELLLSEIPASEAGAIALELGESARSLGELSKDLDESTRVLERALAVSKEAVKAAPNSLKAQRDLRATYLSMGSLWWRRGDPMGALDSTQLELSIGRHLAALDPSTERTNLPWVLGDLGYYELFLGRLRPARSSLEESIAIIDPLKEEQESLHLSYSSMFSRQLLSELDREEGRYRESLAYIDQAISVLESQIASKDGDDPILVEHICEVHCFRALVLTRLGSLDRAAQALDASARFADELTAKGVDPALIINGVACTLHARAALDRLEGRHADARSHAERLLALLQALPAQELTSAVSALYLPRTHTELGLSAHAAGDSAGATRAYEQAIGLYESVVERQPSNTRALRELADTYQNLSETLAGSGNLAESRRRREQALSAYEKVLKLDPQNESAALGLAAIHVRTADLERGEGSAPAAQHHYERAQAVISPLARANPSNRTAQITLAKVHLGLARTAHDTGGGARRAEWIDRARKILAAVLEQDATHAGAARLLAELERESVP